ncbi:MAG: ABC transporter ATP-binding protein [Bacillota bacterium]
MKKKTFRRIFQMLRGIRGVYLFGILGMSLSMLLFQTQIALMFKTLFDTLETGDFSAVIENIRGYLIVVIIGFMLIPVFFHVALKATVRASGIIRKKAFHKLTLLPSRYFQDHHSAEVSSRLTNDIVEMERVYTEHLLRFIVSIITGIGTGIVMFYIEWRLGLFVVITGVLSYAFNMVYAKRLRDISRRVQSHLGILNTKLSNIISGLRVIRIFNIQEVTLDKFIASNDEVYGHSMDRIKHQATIDGFNALFGFAGFIGLTGFGGYLVLNGHTTVGVIVAVVQLQEGITTLIRSLGTFITSMQSSLAAGERVFEVLDENEEPSHYALDDAKTETDTALALENIRFGYGDTPVVKGLFLALKKGQSAALAGPSGAGKSTLFKLVLQFHKPDSGGMVINGKAASTLSLKSIRQTIGYVPQDAFVFSGTVKDNIAYGALDKDKKAIIAAAKSANAHDFIMKLKDGYETVIGENGTTLSGGQRQRIAIARAILKDAPILLLDEATSALDHTNETIVRDALIKLMEGRTSLIIAHRLSTIKHVDTIYVLEDGQIRQKGTHQTLIEEGGLYADWVAHQLVTP